VAEHLLRVATPELEVETEADGSGEHEDDHHRLDAAEW
jgi:hypothetical protein